MRSLAARALHLNVLSDKMCYAAAPLVQEKLLLGKIEVLAPSTTAQRNDLPAVKSYSQLHGGDDVTARSR